ncbi:MAG: nucleoside triphosphate pyrophosphohydrolase [Desulfobacterales bacterium]|nr:nucleoside triphosphate pyrophosphohydrolase [Desulfobacterales bacterium]
MELIERLRAEDGCPWDRRQTPRSMVAYLIEEVYELVDAVLSGSPGEVCEELGDVLFQAFFIAWLYQEQGHFQIADAIGQVHEKMIRRHPHVFGDETAKDAEAVRRRWTEIKKTEKGRSAEPSTLDDIPSGLPALMRAHRVSERAAGAGFDWADLTGVMKKVEEEWAEFNAEVGSQGGGDSGRRRLALEFGDILFTLVNVARFARIHPETALAEAVVKFERRFRYMEAELTAGGATVASTSREELDRRWEEAKSEVDHGDAGRHRRKG